MYLANKLLDSHVKTFITYNKGQTWALLPAPAADVAGNNLHCILVSLSLSLYAGVNLCCFSCEMKFMTSIIHQMFQPHQLCIGCSLIQSQFLHRAMRQLHHQPPKCSRRCSAGMFLLSVWSTECLCVSFQGSRLSINLCDFNLLPVVTLD